MNDSNCNFIRCLKPNNDKSRVWDSKVVLNQIRYLMIINVINIRKDLYPIRIEYAELYEKYWLIDRDTMYSELNYEEHL